MWLADFIFGSKFGQATAAALGLALLVAVWQIDRAMVRADGQQIGRLQERETTRGIVDENVNKARAARTLAAGNDSGRLLADPFVRAGD